MKRVNVTVLGGSGYTAVELIKILLRHPHAAIVAVTSRDAQPVSDYHPVLAGRLDLICEPFDADALQAKGVEVAFGCLPHGTSMEAIPPLLARGIRVVDLSVDGFAMGEASTISVLLALFLLLFSLAYMRFVPHGETREVF